MNLEAYEVATALAEAGDFAAALAAVERGLAQRPDDGRLVVRRVQVRAELGDDADAEAELDRALAVASNVAETLYVRAELMYGWQIYDAAIVDLEHLTAHWPAHPHGWFLRGLTEMGLRRFADAADSFTRDLAAGTPAPETFANRASCRLALGKQHDALADLDAAVALAPDDAAWRLRRDTLRAALGDA